MVDVDLADGGTRTFKQRKKTFRNVDEYGPLRLLKEVRPSGNQIIYSYQGHKEDKKLAAVQAADASGKKGVLQSSL